MFLRVLMDVNDQPCKVGIRCYGNPAKGPLKQSTSALIGVIDRPRVGVEEMRELPAGVWKFDQT
jgi:hypothetical protein